MKNVHEIFREATIEVGKSIIEPTPAEGNGKATKFVMIAILFLGSEGVNVVFRKKFGRNGLNIGMIIGCFVCYEAIAALSFYNFYEPDERWPLTASINSFFVTGVLFTILGIYVLVSGIIHILAALKADDLSENPGESSTLKFLKKDRWTDTQIKYIAEPALVSSLGIGYCFYNPIGGIALILTAISVWGRLVIEILILGNSIIQTMNQIRKISTQPKNRNRVN